MDSDFSKLIETMNAMAKSIDKLSDSQRAVNEKSIKKSGSFISSILGIKKSLVKGIAGGLSGITDQITKPFKDLKNTITKPFGDLKNMITQPFDTLKGIFSKIKLPSFGSGKASKSIMEFESSVTQNFTNLIEEIRGLKTAIIGNDLKKLEEEQERKQIFESLDDNLKKLADKEFSVDIKEKKRFDLLDLLGITAIAGFLTGFGQGILRFIKFLKTPLFSNFKNTRFAKFFARFKDSRFAKFFARFKDSRFAKFFTGFKDSRFVKFFTGFKDSRFVKFFARFKDSRFVKFFSGFKDNRFVKFFSGFKDNRFAKFFTGFKDSRFVKFFTGFKDNRFVKFFTGFKDSRFFKFFSGFKNTRFAKIFSSIGRRLASFGKFLGGIAGRFGSFSKSIAQGSRVFRVFQKFGRFLGRLLTPLVALFGAIKGGIQGFKEDGIFGAIRGAIVGAIDLLFLDLGRMIGGGVGWLVKKLGFEKTGQAISDIIKNAMDAVKDVLGGLVDTILGIVTLDWDRIKQGFQKAFEGLFLHEGLANAVQDTMRTFLRAVLPTTGEGTIGGIASKFIPKEVYEYAGINKKGEDISDQRPVSEETLKSESAFDVSSSLIKSGALSDEEVQKLNKARMDVIDANTSGSDKKIRKATERLEKLTEQIGKVQTMTNESGKALYETSSELNDMNSNRAIGESVLNAVQSSTSNVNNNVSNVTVNQTGQLDPTTSLMFGTNSFGGFSVA